MPWRARSGATLTMQCWSRFTGRVPKASAATVQRFARALASITLWEAPIRGMSARPLWSAATFGTDGQPAHDAPHERPFKEGGKSRAHDGDLFHALQFCTHPSDPKGHSGDGRWRDLNTL